MTGNEYQKLAMKTMNSNLTYREQLMNSCLGLAGEVGEYTDIIKKLEFQDHPLDINDIEKEIGDILWYVALACYVWDFNMNDVMENNIKKLKKRYPDGFKSSQSVNRVE